MTLIDINRSGKKCIKLSTGIKSNIQNHFLHILVSCISSPYHNLHPFPGVSVAIWTLFPPDISSF